MKAFTSQLALVSSQIWRKSCSLSPEQDQLQSESMPFWCLSLSMECDEKQSLIDVYEIAKSTYAYAVHEVRRCFGACTVHEYRDLIRLKDDSRLQAEEALKRLEDHG